MAFSNSSQWNFEHPDTLYAWEGACVWIPCRYTIPGYGVVLENLTVYQNYVYDDKIRGYNGTILYEKTKSQMPESQGRVKFLGDDKSNCTLQIHPVKAQDNGQLGLRMTSKSGKWMEKIVLNVSSKALGMGSSTLGKGRRGVGNTDSWDRGRKPGGLQRPGRGCQ